MNKKAQETDVPKAIAGLLLSVVVLLVLFSIIYSLISYFTDAKDEHKEAIATFDNIAEEVKLLAEGTGSGAGEASITIPVGFREGKDFTYFVSAEDVSSDDEKLCLYVLTGSSKEALKCHSLGVDYTQASFTGQPFDAVDSGTNRKIFNLKITAQKDEKSGVVLVSLVPVR